ncbi:MAG TPA: MFS transporter [Deltaproteobacteria bacterium]|nr:MFS transporter [Deltaproteobacteria bacterium]
MYDFANSSYTTVIITVYYAQLFPTVIVGDNTRGNLLWSVSLSISYALTVLTLPLLGAMMDRIGNKKAFLLGSTILTVVTTAALGLAGPGMVGLAMVLIVLSNYGFSVGESFVASFLPGLGPPGSLGRISGIAWGFGYVGGLLSTAGVLLLLGGPEPGNPAATWAGPLTAAWFALASIPTFWLLRDRSVPIALPEGVSLVSVGFGQLAKTLGEIRRFRDLAVFLVSYFWAMAGLSIVVSFAFIYGAQVIGWAPLTQQLMFLFTQISATVGALGFGWLQGRLGDKPTYALTLLIWVSAVALIWGTPTVASLINGLAGSEIGIEQVFLGVGCIAGLCIGATQSAGRTLVALLSPPDKVGEFFSLWGVFGKLAAIAGLMSLGLLQAAFGLENAILLTGVFFGLGLVVVLGVDMERGRAEATVVPGAPEAP